jgi:hypothetical protein
LNPAHLPLFTDVRAAVEREWFTEARVAAVDAQYRKLLSGFQVEIDVTDASNRFAALRWSLHLVLLVALLGPQTAGAHEVRPGFLDLTETSPNLFDMTWKVPALGAFHLAMEPQFPDFCHFAGEPSRCRPKGLF